MRSLMAAISMDITINAPTDDVWAILADFPAISMWVPMIQHSCDHSRNLGCEPQDEYKLRNKHLLKR